MVSLSVKVGKAPVWPLVLVDPLTPGGQQPNGLTGFTLGFSDEFAGAALDQTKWDYLYPNWPIFTSQSPGGRGTNTGNTCVNNLAHVTTDGTSAVILKAEKLTTVSGLAYTSGMIQSLPSFTVAAGSFVECRMKLSTTAAGLWPSFWMSNSTFNTWPPEIDVMEITASTPNGKSLANTFTAGNSVDSQSYSVSDFTVYHTYGARWNKNGTVDFYLDGSLVASSTQVITGSQYLLLDLATDSNAVFTSPITLTCDYIRAWTF